MSEDTVLLAIAILALATSAIVARSFQTTWAGVLCGVIAGAIVGGVLGALFLWVSIYPFDAF